MVSSRWQKQHSYFQAIVWAVSAVISTLLIIILLLLGFGIEMAGVFFIIVFLAMRVLLAFLLKNRFANSMVRILKFDYEEIEREFRMLFKHKYIRYHRKLEEDAYHYEFPGHSLSMTVEPYWLLFMDPNQQKATKITLRILNAKNKEFAEMLADSIDEMAAQHATSQEKA